MIADHLDIQQDSYIDGRYRVARKVGSGSYGDVFKVAQGNGDTYALKLLRLWEVPSSTRDELVRKFRQEYETAQIESEYLVRSRQGSYGVVQGNPYFLMDYCPNGDLSKIVSDGTTHVVEYANDILQGLYAIHTAGLVHRDLKPENVLIRANGHAALTDFGVVGDNNHRTRPVGWFNRRIPQALGTPLYMAPEMYDRRGGGLTYLPTIDLWSFGVMMFQLLTHDSFPFGDIDSIDELEEYMNRAKKRNRDNFDKLNGVKDGDYWYYIIDKLLEPDQRKRYQSAIDVWRDISPLADRCSRLTFDIRQTRSQHVTRIRITQGADVDRVYVLGDLLPYRGRIVEAGRSDSNQVVLRETGELNYVSRHHFTLERSRDGTFWVIRDGQWDKNERSWVTSTNGTYLNAARVDAEGMKIFTGDIITAGEYKIKVE